MKKDAHIKNMSKSLIFGLLLTTLIVTSLTPILSASTHYIDPSDPDMFTTIQSAIDASSPGDLILIHPGVYNESITINKELTIEAVSEKLSVINPSGSTGVTINHNDVHIHGLTITNASIGIDIAASNCTLTNNTFLSNQKGIMILKNSLNTLIYQNNFINNNISADNNGTNTMFYSSEKGNYWKEYNESDTNNDGIGDYPFIISENTSDPFPVMNPITIHPVADFFSSPASPSTQTVISFTDLSTDPDGHIISWNWSFDDGSFSTEKEPTHQYADDGLYTIQLTVTDNLGVSHSESYTLNVRNTAPTAFFTFHPQAPLDIQEVDFRDNSTDADGTITKRKWFINNTLHDETSMFRYTFPDDGAYTVSLTVTDDDGDTDSYSETISVQNVAPSAGFIYSTENDNLSKNKPINFQDTSNDVDGTIISYHWDFGDGITSTEQNPSHSYDADGRYKITLSITDNDGKTDSYGKQIQVGLTKNPEGFLSVLSMSDIIIVIIIFSALITVFIISKKYI